MLSRSLCAFFILLFFFNTDVSATDLGGISGQIRVYSFQENAIGFTVEAVDSNENVIASAVTDTYGMYELSGITASQVFLRIPEQFGYKKTFYNGSELVSNATPVTIIPNGVVQGINVELEELLVPPDSDLDNIRDAEEVILGADGYRTNPADTDTDGDTLSDMEETTLGSDAYFTNPTADDTDNDSISDSIDSIPALSYIKVYVTHGALPSESTTIVAEVRDLYYNLIDKNDIEFSLHCSGSAVFANSINTGTLVSGGATSTVIVRTSGGIVSIDVSSPIVEDVIIQPSDSALLGLLAFSSATPFYPSQIPVSPMGGEIDTLVQYVDDFARNVPMGISFTHFGTSYTHADLHSNGFITFDLFSGIPTEAFFEQMYTNDPIPDVTIPNAFIAPYWDDLDIEAHGTGKLFYTTQNTIAGTVFRVKWIDHGIYDSREPVNASLTFQALLYEHSNLIMFSYEKLVDGTTHTANGSSATIGVENSTGEIGIQVSYNTVGITEGSVIILSTQADPTAHFLPYDGDYDNDGLSNGEERTVSFTDPVNPDSDGDTLPDKWEYENSLNPNFSGGLHGADGDYDNDGLTNSDELFYLTAANNIDSDNDGLSDGDEVFEYKTIPNIADTDGDTLIDGEEINFGSDGFRSNPLEMDSDNDGINDNVDSIPVFARLVIIEPSNVSIGNPDPDPVKFQLWSLDGDLLTPVDDLVIEAHVSGDAFFGTTAEQGTILSGGGTNTITVQLRSGEAYIKVRDFTEEEVFFYASDSFSSGVRFPMQSAGYETIPCQFVDIADPDNLLSLTGDDVSLNINLPAGFFFRFFGELYSSINPLKVSSNGYMTFSSYGTSVSNRDIPYHGQNDPDAYFAPYWDDLVVPSDSVYAAVTGQYPSRRMTVQWNNVVLASNQQLTLNFQVVVYELDSLIEFNYAVMSADGSSATIGIENASGDSGVRIGYNTAVLTSYSSYALFDGDVPSMQFINGDHDGDGLSDLDEINNYGTDPGLKDTDGDGLEDDDEILVYNTDPSEQDPDNDGLTDFQEKFDYYTDPFDSDSDNDSFSDSQEVTAGTDPNDPLSYLHITRIYQNMATQAIVIEWSSVPGKEYNVYATSGSFGTDYILLENNVIASDSETSYSDEGDVLKGILHPKDEPSRLYKIIVAP